MERGEYHKAKVTLDRAQRGIEILIHAHVQDGPQFDEVKADLLAAHAELETLLDNSTSSQRELATLDREEFWPRMHTDRHG